MTIDDEESRVGLLVGLQDSVRLDGSREPRHHYNLLFVAIISDVCSIFFSTSTRRRPRLPEAVGCSFSVAAPAPSSSCLGNLSCELAAMSAAAPLMLMLLAVAVTLAPLAPVAQGGGGSAAHPSYTDGAGAAGDTCGPGSGGAEVRLEEHGGGRIIDITHAYRADLPAPGRDGLGPVTRLTESMANGSVNNVSELRMVVHSGTHVDAPGHMVQEHFVAGLDVDKLDLDVLNGPALLIDVPRDTNITAQAMESLNIPKGIRRVLFRTLNTDKKLMWTKEIDTSFVGFTEDGAQWLLDNTEIKLVGVDYLSFAAFDHLISAHLVFLNRPDMIPIEGLKLDHVKAGIYMLHCLPLRLIGCDGSPIRCILIK